MESILGSIPSPIPAQFLDQNLCQNWTEMAPAVCTKANVRHPHILSESGRAIQAGERSLVDLWQQAHASDTGPAPVSGQQERLENWVRSGIERA